MTSLQKKIIDLQQQLKSLIREYNIRKSRGLQAVSPDTLEALERALPGMCFCNADEIDGLLGVQVRDAVLRYHVPHTSNDDVNDNIIYCTLPLHSFAAYIRTGMHLEMYNHTRLSPRIKDHPLFGIFSGAPFSHPHVQQDTPSDRGQAFKNVCYGNNKFNTLLDTNPLTPGMLLDFIRRFHIWVTSANLGDMYGSFASRVIDLKYGGIDAEETDRLFHRAQTDLAPIILSGIYGEASSCLRRIIDECAFENDAINYTLGAIRNLTEYGYNKYSIAAFQFSYALWLYKNRSVIRDVQPGFGKDCLWNSIKVDIVSAECLSTNAYEKQERFIPQIINAPKALKEQFRKSSLGSTERFTEISNQIID